MEDVLGNCLGVLKDSEFPGITPQNVDAGKEGFNQGVVATELMCDDEEHPHGGPRVS